MEWRLCTRPVLCTLLSCAAWQYVHGIAAQAALFAHRPAPPLEDFGFELIPEWPTAAGWAFSELMTLCLAFCFCFLLVLPFLVHQPTFSSVAVLRRFMASLVACQMLRISCFLATRLPSPAPHCRLGEAYQVVPPTRLLDFLLVDAGRVSSRGCGDLVFSSHATFGLLFALAVYRYGCSPLATGVCILLCLLQQYGILAARKHYSLDIIVALFAVPLVYDALDRRLVDPQHAAKDELPR